MRRRLGTEVLISATRGTVRTRYCAISASEWGHPRLAAAGRGLAASVVYDVFWIFVDLHLCKGAWGPAGRHGTSLGGDQRRAQGLIAGATWLAIGVPCEGTGELTGVDAGGFSEDEVSSSTSTAPSAREDRPQEVGA